VPPRGSRVSCPTLPSLGVSNLDRGPPEIEEDDPDRFRGSETDERHKATYRGTRERSERGGPAPSRILVRFLLAPRRSGLLRWWK